MRFKEALLSQGLQKKWSPSERKGKNQSILTNNSGVAMIFMIFFLASFLIFFLILVDFAYIYYVKGEMQNAADAAVLAGAPLIDKDKPPDEQDAALTEARKFASLNNAAGSQVRLNDEDVEFGLWDWDERTFTPNATPVNAIRVAARRTENDADGVFDIFFASILGVSGIPALGSAIAVLPEKVESPMGFCVNASSQGVTLPHLFYWAPYSQEIDPGLYGTAWTLFDSESQATPTQDLIDFYFCKKPLGRCPQTPVYTNNGNNNAVAKQFRCAFKNPSYDAANKFFDGGGNVIGWNVLAPAFEQGGCPPGAQPSPYSILGYARVTITEVYASGGGGTANCACRDLANDYPAIFEASRMTGNVPNAIMVSAIEYPVNVRVNACPADRQLGISTLVR